MIWVRFEWVIRERVRVRERECQIERENVKVEK